MSNGNIDRITSTVFRGLQIGVLSSMSSNILRMVNKNFKQPSKKKKNKIKYYRFY